MNIPIFEELELSDYTEKYLTQKFTQSKIGQAPYFIKIPQEYSETRINQIIETINIAFKLLQIHPVFPYPLYIISEKEVDNSTIPIVKNEKGLPTHFLNKPKRLKPLEFELNNKAKLIADKIRNIAIDQRLEKIQSIKKDQKILHRISKEHTFYQSLEKKLQKMKRNNN